jgi:hypothetical protein
MVSPPGSRPLNGSSSPTAVVGRRPASRVARPNDTRRVVLNERHMPGTSPYRWGVFVCCSAATCRFPPPLKEK